MILFQKIVSIHKNHFASTSLIKMNPVDLSWHGIPLQWNDPSAFDSDIIITRIIAVC